MQRQAQVQEIVELLVLVVELEELMVLHCFPRTTRDSMLLQFFVELLRLEQLVQELVELLVLVEELEVLQELHYFPRTTKGFV